MINITIQDPSGKQAELEIPEGVSLSLMEVLKASDYQVPATCGGMALCATCRVEVLHSAQPLDDPTDAELDMLDTLPDASETSRLSCQIRVGPQLNGAVFRLNPMSE
ncbi:MAG: 2Fe-2S iron-sulfur cluster-binding protein [Cyclobacteriaceae bacterium]|jgi:2Fe-2S ferredoxin|nr:2Fe-2S iron-sulfur cluster-binding protein [Cyclobacteriaceae bacterium]